MAMFRHYFCVPQEYANTLCVVPVYSSEAGEVEWCLTNYNATDCASIRNNAQDRTKSFLWTFYTANAIWGTFLIALVCIHTLKSNLVTIMCT